MTKTDNHPLTTHLTPFIAATIALCVYCFTTAPDLTTAHYGGDGGELITAAFTLGIPHPPGYPTYVLLGKLFSYLPIGTVAYRFNLFSAVSAATAIFFITHTHLHTSPNKTPYNALATGLTVAFAPLLWGQATITEVYSLNLALVALVIWAVMEKRPFFLIGFLFGLSLTTHLTSLLLLPLCLSALTPSSWRQWGMGLLLGLTPFLALPVLAQTHSPVVWGNPTTLQGWWWLVSGRLYQPNLFSLPLTQLWSRLIDWFWLLAPQFTWAFPLLLLSSLLAPPSSLLVPPSSLLSLLLYLLYALTYNTSDAIVFCLPALLLLSFPLAAALHPWGKLALLLPLSSLLIHFNGQNLSREVGERPFASTIWQQAPTNAILQTPGDKTIFSLWYFQHIEGQRPDVILVDENLFAFDWYRARLQTLYPNLQGLEVDNIGRFQQLNTPKRPYLTCHPPPATCHLLPASP